METLNNCLSISPHSEVQGYDFSVPGAVYCIGLPGISVVIHVQPRALEMETLNNCLSICPHSEVQGYDFSVPGAACCIGLPSISVVIHVQPWALEIKTMLEACPLCICVFSLSVHMYTLVYNTYTVTHWGVAVLLNESGRVVFFGTGWLYIKGHCWFKPCKLIWLPFFLQLGSVSGLLGPCASSFYVPPPESHQRDSVDRCIARSRIPSHGGWTQAPTEVPLYVPSIAISRQEPSGPLPSPPKWKSSGKRTWWANSDSKCWGRWR